MISIIARQSPHERSGFDFFSERDLLFVMKIKALLPVLLVLAAGILAYSNSFSVPFQFDDRWNIVENPLLHDLRSFAGTSKGYEYNPRRFAGYLTLALNYHFGGTDVTGYHVVNLAIHLTTSVLVYFLVLLTFRTPHFRGVRSRSEVKDQGGDIAPLLGSAFTVDDSRFSFVALFSALLFVAHPVQTQAVTYIVQRFASMATMFYLLAVVMYIKGRLGLTSSISLSGLNWFLFSLFSAVIALRTKETAFTIPLVIVLYEFVFFRSSLKKKGVILGVLLLAAALVFFLTLNLDRPLGEIISDLSEQTRVQTEISRGDYFLTQLRVLTTYIRLLFFPINQNLDYDYPIYHSLFIPSVFLSFLFLLALLGAAADLLYRTRSPFTAGSGGQTGRTQGSPLQMPDDLQLAGPRSPVPDPLYRLIAFGILWFFITISIESSFIPIVDVIFEHRVYMPCVGFFIAIAAAGRIAVEKMRLKGKNAGRVAAVLSVSVLLLFTAAAYSRNEIWRDEASLWEDVLSKSPGNPRAYNNFGYLLLDKRQNDKAAPYFAEALRIQPAYVDAQNNLGVAYYNMGFMKGAIEQFRAVLDLAPSGPDAAEAHHNLGLAYLKSGMTDESVLELEAASGLEPDSPYIYNDLGVAYRKGGRLDKAIVSFETAVRLKPDYAGAHYNLGLAYEAAGIKGQAGEYLRKAHNLDPKRF